MSASSPSTPAFGRAFARLVAEELHKLQQRDTPPEQYLTPEQAAQYLHCSLSLIYHEKSRIPHVTVGRKLLFTREGLTLWAQRRV